MWFDIPVGSVNTKNAPKRITTDIKVDYQQKLESYCVLYGLSSALVYCGYDREACKLSQHAEIISKLPRDGQIQELHKKMAAIIPVIGKFISFNVRIKKKQGSHN